MSRDRTDVGDLSNTEDNYPSPAMLLSGERPLHAEMIAPSGFGHHPLLNLQSLHSLFPTSTSASNAPTNGAPNANTNASIQVPYSSKFHSFFHFSIFFWTFFYFSKLFFYFFSLNFIKIRLLIWFSELKKLFNSMKNIKDFKHCCRTMKWYASLFYLLSHSNWISAHKQFKYLISLKIRFKIIATYRINRR